MKNSFLLVFIVLWGCTFPRKGEVHNEKLIVIEEINPEYASGFKLYKTDQGILLEVLKPYVGATSSLKYLFVSKISRAGDSTFQSDSITVIQVPVQSIICTSTSHIPLLTYLNEQEKLVGFPNTEYISNKKMRARIDEGLVTDVGSADQLNTEKVMGISPDLIMAYSVNDLQSVSRLEQYGQKVLVNSDFLEKTPLGRSEWIKVAGLLFGKYEMADSIFQQIRDEYNKYRLPVAEGPCAFSGSVYGDAWFMPGGRNGGAKLLQDAGFQYDWGGNEEEGHLKLGFERVFEKSGDCDFWIGPSPFKTLNDLGEADQRYQKFKAFQNGNVFVYDNKMGDTGGNEYFEEGYLRPDIILKDLISIREPGSVEGHELYFYRKLQ